ncbi:hypothetical protein NVP1055O_28 [Vibrio phage 1.055.O._10N.286.55.E9]|nr:hypothetical protein NVP1055O_28 [Vibrio phage 1.055.O._10N.286.55.E9]
MVNITPIKITPTNAYQSMVVVNCDDATNRCILVDRSDCSLVGCKLTNVTTTVRFRVPMKYSTSNTLLALILDDDGEFNAAAADGVKAEVIDGLEVVI